MLFGVLALIAVVTAGNLYLGTFKAGFENQPIARTDGLWNFLSMALVGLCGVFMSGCPLRQIVKAGHGDSDSHLRFRHADRRRRCPQFLAGHPARPGRRMAASWFVVLGPGRGVRHRPGLLPQGGSGSPVAAS